MNTTKKLLVIGVFVCGASGLWAEPPAYSQSKLRMALFDIQFILNNESFALQEVYHESVSYKDVQSKVRVCVFESSSAVWVIKYCHLGEALVEDLLWHLNLNGSFEIKESDIKLQYYLRRESNVYRNIEYGSLAFTKHPGLQNVVLLDGELTVNIGYSPNRLAFLQNLARAQESHIEASIEE